VEKATLFRTGVVVFSVICLSFALIYYDLYCLHGSLTMNVETLIVEMNLLVCIVFERICTLKNEVALSCLKKFMLVLM